MFRKGQHASIHTNHVTRSTVLGVLDIGVSLRQAREGVVYVIELKRDYDLG